ncbi:hypothetical protein TSUD_183890 [Trifolium subterraneum]|uniref:Bifunctional inhibitor/plant lipid transfer protein/seed storage helical domain-containing protein n=1 Tax=Trifolium subterraneum TaxID=3900 RepID=A0A2Z6LXM1_TRISU|nr:hypothetical protein TSUD_183890 [Trifolium subterraneum]
MGGFNFKSITCLASFMVLLMMINNTVAQDIPSCGSDLVPCGAYLNSSKPPSSCCDPLKKTVATQLTCLCNLFYTPGLLETLGINITQALALSKNCGVTTDISNCKHAGSAPPPTAGSPPATKGGDKAAAGRVSSFTGFSFLLLLASMIFN